MFYDVSINNRRFYIYKDVNDLIGPFKFSEFTGNISNLKVADVERIIKYGIVNNEFALEDLTMLRSARNNTLYTTGNAGTKQLFDFCHILLVFYKIVNKKEGSIEMSANKVIPYTGSDDMHIKITIDNYIIHSLAVILKKDSLHIPQRYRLSRKINLKICE